MVKLEIKGKKKEYPKGARLLDVAEKENRKAIAAVYGGVAVDLATKVNKPGEVEFIEFGCHEGNDIFWHSSAHIFAQAITSIFPKTKLAIGPPVEGGWYYDFELEHKINNEDLKQIESVMKKIVKENYPFVRKEVSRSEAMKLFKDNPFKKEMIGEFEGKLSIYKQGDFIDLCRGPHVPSTGYIKAAKLTKVAGAYWRGDAKNKMLQRIYGIAFQSRDDLKEHVRMLEEAEKRDHRKLGQQLDLFSMHDEGPGFPFFHPNGMIVLNELIDFWREEHAKLGYVEVRGPTILSKDLWLQSGHWDHYKKNMYFTEIDEQEYAVKPMNCPAHILIYKSDKRSYRELPMKMSELGYVHRHELSGTLHGLMRVRAFTQDDAHIFCKRDQIQDAVREVMDLVDHVYKVFGFEYHVELSTRPDDAMGDAKLWEIAEDSLEKALKANKMKYKINPGDGAFYGPKIDFHIKDCIGRTWQCATIQLDFTMPEKFNMEYIGEDNKPHRPVMLHRVIYGSLERFFGILIEHYAGAFPLWLAPTQVEVIPVADRNIKHAEKVLKELLKVGLRAKATMKGATVSYKIRQAQLRKVPYMLVIGDKEQKSKKLMVRKRDGKILKDVPMDKFILGLKKEIDAKK